jgi:hypothetical protein
MNPSQLPRKILNAFIVCELVIVRLEQFMLNSYFYKLAKITKECQLHK